MGRKKRIVTECDHCGDPRVYLIGFCRKCYNAYTRRNKYIRLGKPLTDDLKDAPGPKPKDNYRPQWMDDENNFGCEALHRGSTIKYGKIPEWHFSSRMFPGVLEGIKDEELKQAMIDGDIEKFMELTEP